METVKIICDTDVMIDYLDQSKPRHSLSKQIIEDEIGLDYVTLSAITKMELIAGVPNKFGLAVLNKNIDWFNILLINPAITLLAIQLMETFKLSHNLAMPDALIAATAIHSRLKLFTFNKKDFKFITGVQLYQHIHA